MLLISGSFKISDKFSSRGNGHETFDSHWNHLKDLLKHKILGPLESESQLICVGIASTAI